MKTDLSDIKKQVSLIRVASQHTQLENRGSEYWGCCPFHQEKTPSFAIKQKNGEEVFFCQGCQVGGDVIKFVEMVDNCSVKMAIEKVKQLAGVWAEQTEQNKEWQDVAQRVQQVFTPVAEKPKKAYPIEAFWPRFEKALAENQPAMDWLRDVRGLGPETVKQLRLGYTQAFKGELPPEHEHVRNSGWILFPRVEKENVVDVKMRSFTSKCFVKWGGMDARALYNSETINALEAVFVTEGELDTAIMEQAGFRAVSMPNSTTKLTPKAKATLKVATEIFLAGDNDGKVGNAAMMQLQRELKENTYILLWQGAKDANEFFLKVCKGNIDEFRKQVFKLIDKARGTPIEGFTSLLERLRNTAGTDAGADPNRLHFSLPSVDRMNYSPPGSIVVVYSTYSGTGKSVFTTQMMIDEAKLGEIVVVYSPELRDENYLALVAAQVIGPHRPNGLNRAHSITQADYQETAAALDKPTARGTDFRFYVGHSLPETDPDKVMDFIEQTLCVTGATRMVIDTLHRIIERGSRESQTEAEGRIVKRLEAMAIKYGTIFVLVGQSNKEAEEIKELRKDAHGVLRGSRELTDVSYAIYLLHRKRKNPGAGEVKDLLELETDVILKKDRGKGPGNAIVHLIYRPECSRFYECDRTAVEPGDQQRLHNDPDEFGVE